MDCESARQKREKKKKKHLILPHPTSQHLLTPAVTGYQLPDNLLVGSTQPPLSNSAQPNTRTGTKLNKIERYKKKDRNIKLIH